MEGDFNNGNSHCSWIYGSVFEYFSSSAYCKGKIMNFDDLIRDATEILDLRPDGWKRDNFFNMTKLAEECGEVAECLAKSNRSSEELGDELSDVIIVCAIIALRANINLEEACKRKQAKRIKKVLRKYHNGHYPS